MLPSPIKYKISVSSTDLTENKICLLKQFRILKKMERLLASQSSIIMLIVVMRNTEENKWESWNFVFHYCHEEWLQLRPWSLHFPLALLHGKFMNQFTPCYMGACSGIINFYRYHHSITVLPHRWDQGLMLSVNVATLSSYFTVQLVEYYHWCTLRSLEPLFFRPNTTSHGTIKHQVCKMRVENRGT